MNDADYRKLINMGVSEIVRDSMIRQGRSAPIDIYSYYSGGDWTSPTPAGEENTPPRAYTSAREKVASYIAPAPEQSFDDIAGNSEALSLLRDAITSPVTHKKLYESYGLAMPKGALLFGPPGCGKTMFARAAASEMRKLYGDKMEFLSISGTEIQSPYVGQTEKIIKQIFTFAREYKAYHGHPLLVFIDEADALLPDRTGRGGRRVHSWEESQVATFLAEMDGMQESGAFVLLATNRPEAIDQAVLRDGRCDFKIEIKRPNLEAVEAILRSTFAGVKLAPKFDIETVVFTAVETLYDPHRIILDARKLRVNMADGAVTQQDHRHFLLEHIISGAMVASIAMRSKRHAFARDKAKGEVTGVSSDDVVAAVNDIFEENRNLDHGFALKEFAIATGLV